MGALPSIWLVHNVFLLYYAILVIRVVGSYFPPSSSYSPWAKLLGLAYALTEPLLRPIRRVLHPYQRTLPLDFSPLVLIILLSIAERALVVILWQLR